jgi:3-isopropylmalate/(R)-2-methylmalate dehydratase small subunit
MEAFTTHTGTAVPLRQSNVDTDQIIPGEYLKRTSRDGFSDGLFATWREDPQFPLNLPQYRGASILVAGNDFGTGSSREHAVWALWEGGFRVVISPRFGDIFRANSLKNGLLTVALDKDTTAHLQDRVEQTPHLQLEVDLSAREVRYDGSRITFDISDFDQMRLIRGQDDIDLTLSDASLITSFETTRPSHLPRIT